jgi:hypothetical protein
MGIVEELAAGSEWSASYARSAQIIQVPSGLLARRCPRPRSVRTFLPGIRRTFAISGMPRPFSERACTFSTRLRTRSRHSRCRRALLHGLEQVSCVTRLA